jgi:hypothetical protein
MQTETAVQDKVINGVNVDRLFGTIDAVKDKPGLARFTFGPRAAGSVAGTSARPSKISTGQGRRTLPVRKLSYSMAMSPPFC